MATINAQPVELILENTRENVDVLIVDSQEAPQTPSLLTLDILDSGGTVKLSDNLATAGTRITKVSGVTGRYYFPFGAIAGETDDVGDYMFRWAVEIATGVERANVLQVVKVRSAAAFAMLPILRGQIDKAGKAVQAELGVTLGYTDSQLMLYLEGGVQLLNVYGQDQYTYTVDNFPATDYLQLLVFAALYVGLTAQAIYAVDSDVDFSDSGYSMRLDKFPKLTQKLNMITQQIEKLVRPFKESHIRTGSIRTEIGPNYRLRQVLTSAPAGAIFRNVMMAGR